MKNKLLLLILFALAVVSLGYYVQNRGIDSDAILARSVLKDKKFASKVQQIQSADLTAYFLEEHSNPIIAISFTFRNAGSAYETEDKQGVTAVLENMLMNGAGEYDAIAFQDISEEYGIRIGFDAGQDNFGGFVRMPSAHKDMAVKLLADVLYRPRFDDSYLDLTKKQLQRAIKIGEEKIGMVLANAFAKNVFGDHPYARPQIGTVETIENIRKKDLQAFMQQHFTRQNIIIGIAGDISQAQAEELMQQVFGQLPENFAVEPLPKIELTTTGAQHNVPKTFAQAMTHFVTTGTTRQSEDFYPLYLANYIFGDAGLNSRISQVVREKNGLTYGIYTYLSFKDAVPLLSGGYSATPENFEPARQLLLEEWQKMGAHGVTNQELTQAKRALIAAHNLRFASIGGISDMLVAMQQYDLGLDFLDKRNDYIRNVTLAQVNEAARKYFGKTPDFVNIGVQKTDKEEEK